MLPGVSTACFYPQYTEQSLRQLMEIPVAAVEIFVNCRQETEDHYCRELRLIAEGSGARIVSLHPYTSGMEPMYFFSGYDRRYREGLEEYKRFFNAAAVLGAQMVVFHGNIAQSQISCEEYCERYEPLLREARRFGVELCHENVSRCVGRDPGFFVQMGKLLPDACYVLDTKQALRSQSTPLAFVQAMAGRVRHIHISDHDSQHDCLPPGQGTFNIEFFLREAAKQGFDGSVVVEIYRENFHRFVEITQGYQRLCRCISTI